jgi:hypothetical protein
VFILKKPFEVKNSNGNVFKFSIGYKIETVPGSYMLIIVQTIELVVLKIRTKISMPYGYSGFMLVESEYFNKTVNNSEMILIFFSKKQIFFYTFLGNDKY